MDTFEQKRNLGLEVVETIRGLQPQTDDISTSVIGKNPYRCLVSLTILIWDIVHTHSCACRKPQKWCINCTAIYRSAWTVYQESAGNQTLPPLIAALAVNLYYTIELNAPGQSLIPQLTFKTHLNPHGPIVEAYNAAANKYYQMLICKMASDSIGTCGKTISLMHWARSFASPDLDPKVATFKTLRLDNRGDLNDPNFARCVEWLRKACPDRTSHETFRKICGSRSEEYGRSLWHLSSACMDAGCWSQVVSFLRPLVEQSMERPSLSWSHERCIIMLPSCFLEMGNAAEARAVLVRVREAYAKKGMVLRSIENSHLLARKDGKEVSIIDLILLSYLHISDADIRYKEKSKEASMLDASRETEQPANSSVDAEPWQIFLNTLPRP